MAKVLIEESIPSQVNTALRHFSKKQADSLDRKELEALFTNISRHLSTIQTSVSVANAYPFDTSRVQDAVDCGFTRQHVIDCLQIMHDQGQDTSNFNLLLDRCLHYQDNPKPNGAPNSLSLSRQNSGKDDVKHQEQLKQQLKSAVEEKEELRTCKICYENIMDCVLLQCGHLTACQSCAVSMQKSDLPCPCCRRKITGNFKVYWS